MRIEDAVAAELDATLAALIEADKVESAARREHQAATKIQGDLEVQAHRLRLALYKLEGSDGSHGDANSDNHKRKQAIARGEVTVLPDRSA